MKIRNRDCTGYWRSHFNRARRRKAMREFLEWLQYDPENVRLIQEFIVFMQEFIVNVDPNTPGWDWLDPFRKDEER